MTRSETEALVERLRAVEPDRTPNVARRLCIRAAHALAALSARPSREAEIERLQHVIDHDRYAAAIVLNNIKGVMRGYSWLSEAGRGSYAWDDERYQREFGDALDAIEAALTPLARLAWDKTDCTTDPDKVAAASVAGRERFALLRAIPSSEEGVQGALARKIASAVMQWGHPHFKHIVSFNTLCEAIEAALQPDAIALGEKEEG